MNLPTPACRYGYTVDQIGAIMGPRVDEFDSWMRGQTRAICEGRHYNYLTAQYEVSEDGVAHGVVTYPWDVERFLEGRPIID